MESITRPSHEQLGSPVIVTRVYNNGDRVTKTMTPREANEEVSYNRECRFGCAVFANAVCVQEGYLCSERCAAISRELENT